MDEGYELGYYVTQCFKAINKCLKELRRDEGV